MPSSTLVEQEPPLPQKGISPEKFALLLERATTLFLNHGYEATHMSLVAQSAGISKKTLYKVFSSKEDLLRTVVAERLGRLAAGLVEQRDPKKSPQEELTAYLTAICGFALSEEAAGLYRLVLAEGSHFPELVHAYLEEGTARGRDVLATWIEAQQAQGSVKTGDAAMLAGMLINMVTAEPLREFVLGRSDPPSSEKLAPRVNLAVELFFHGALAGSYEG